MEVWIWSHTKFEVEKHFALTRTQESNLQFQKV